MLFKKKDVSNFFLAVLPSQWRHKVAYRFSWYKRDIKCMKTDCDALQLKQVHIMSIIVYTLLIDIFIAHKLIQIQ